MKLSPIIIWIVFFAVFSIIKSLAKKAEQSQSKNNTAPNNGSDPLQDFFNQLDNVKTTKSVSNTKPEVKSVDDFFNKPRVKNQSMRKKVIQKPKEQKYANKDKEKKTQVFASAARRDPFKIAEQKSFRDSPDVISVYSEEERAFKNKIVGEEGSVDHFGDKVCNKHKYKFTNFKNMKQAVVWAEILKKPKALQ